MDVVVQGFNTYYQRLTYHPNDANADDEFSTLPDLPDDEEDLSSTQQATSPLVNELATANGVFVEYVVMLALTDLFGFSW